MQSTDLIKLVALKWNILVVSGRPPPPCKSVINSFKFTHCFLTFFSDDLEQIFF